MLLVIRFQVAVRQTYLCACLSNFYQFWYSLIKLATEKYVELKRILTLIVRVDVDPQTATRALHLLIKYELTK